MQKPTFNDRPADQLLLDEIIEAFEVQWNRDGEARVERYLPRRDHPDYETVSVELLCVDFERRARSGHRKSVDDYRRQFPDLLENRQALERLAFEEYRWFKHRGDPASPAAYARRYQIRTDHWPEAITPDATVNRLREVVSFPQVGERFLDFDIVEQLGESSLARVYLATQGDLAGRFVVIKVAADLWSESERLARLQHTNVVPIYSVHEQDGLQAVCMPYFGRHTLADLLPNFDGGADFNGSAFRELLFSEGNEVHVPPANSRSRVRQLSSLNYERLCTWVAAQIASGLAHAHERGILHRDLKPPNILLTDDCQPMILDFNLSEDIVAGGRDSLIVGGTMPYMAPEHLKAVFSIGDIDVRSDIYSLGVILFQLLTGRLPFPPQDGSILATLSLVISERSQTTPSVRKLNPRISPALNAIVERCLAPDPNQRYECVSELQEDLELHLQDFPARHAPNPSISERMHKWSRRNRRFALRAVVGALAVFLVVATSCLALLEHRRAALQAVDDFHQFEAHAGRARAPLSVPLSHDETIELGFRDAELALSVYQIGSRDSHWMLDRSYRMLNSANQSRLAKLVQELLFLMAETSLRKAQTMDDGAARRSRLRTALDHNDLSQQAEDTPRRAWLAQEAEIRRLLGQNQEADRLAQAAHQLPVVDAIDRYAMAVQFMAQRRYTEALPLLEELAEESPHNYFVWYLLGICHYSSEELSQADLCFTRCEAFWPENYLAYLQRGVSRMRDGRYLAAEEDFSRSLEKFPEQTTSLVNRAMARMNLGQPHGAVEDLTRAIQRERDHSLMYLLRSKAWKQLGDSEQSKRDRQAALNRVPVTVDGWIHRGLARLSDDPQGAMTDLEQALRRNPKSRRALQNKAHVLADHLNRPDDAIKSLNRILKWNPRDAAALVDRAVLRGRLGRRDGAIRDAREALRLQSSAKVCYQAACAFAQTSTVVEDDAREAVKLLGEATQRDLRWAALATKDPDMQPLANRPDYRRVVAAAAYLSKTNSTCVDDGMAAPASKAAIHDGESL